MQTNCVAIIPARGGSKRIPKKNIKDFFGKPLIAYSIEVAIRSKLFSKIIVSTDDEEIATIAKKYGAEVPFMRPKNLSDDFTGTQDVVDHVIKYLDEQGEHYKFICTIYATAPLLQKKYLVQGYKELQQNNAVNSFSATSMPFPIQRTFKITNNGRCKMFFPENYLTRSQDLEEAYQDAGQFYFENRVLAKQSRNKVIFSEVSIPIILPRYLVQDIDTLEDWRRAELMYKILNQDIRHKDLTRKQFLPSKKDEIKLSSPISKVANKNYNKLRNILFRSDSSSSIGTGHIMRDLVLASQYNDAAIIFAVQDLDRNINHKIIEAGYGIEILKTNHIEEIHNIILKYNIDMIVIDHYQIDYKYEKELKKRNKKLKILSFDDTYEKHYCDILLNHNISANTKKYQDLVPNHCEIRCGIKHTLIRDEFLIEKMRQDIFIAMGGADHSNLNIKILEVLKRFNNITVNIVTTTANQNLEELKKHINKKSWIKLHINLNHIAKLIKKSDFAIITPSVIANEVYFMDIPFIVIKTASNQKEMYKYLKKKNFPTMKKFNPSILRKHLLEILEKKEN